MRSASRTGMPFSFRRAAIVLLPEAMPPVNPTRKIMSVSKSPAALREVDGVRQKHGYGQRAEAERNRSQARGLRANADGDAVADERPALPVEFGATRDVAWDEPLDVLG